MKDLVKEYSNDEITVVWQPGKCTHSAVCAKTLSEVFRPKERPWIDLQGSDNDSIVKTVRQCPSGALSIKGDTDKQSVVDIDSDTNIAIKVFENGPAMVKGKVVLTLADGTEQEIKNPALCRCGASENKPLCDGSHVKCGFRG